jgi:hypothetical protein
MSCCAHGFLQCGCCWLVNHHDLEYSYAA